MDSSVKNLLQLLRKTRGRKKFMNQAKRHWYMCTYTIQKSSMDNDSLLVPLNQPIKGRGGK
jgi:hypothetical protein